VVRRPSVPPKIFEPFRRQFGVAHRVLNIFVAEIGLQRPRIVPLVGKGIATGVEAVRHFPAFRRCGVQQIFGSDQRNSGHATRSLEMTRMTQLRHWLRNFGATQHGQCVTKTVLRFCSQSRDAFSMTACCSSVSGTARQYVTRRDATGCHRSEGFLGMRGG